MELLRSFSLRGLIYTKGYQKDCWPTAKYFSKYFLIAEHFVYLKKPIKKVFVFCLSYLFVNKSFVVGCAFATNQGHPRKC